MKWRENQKDKEDKLKDEAKVITSARKKTSCELISECMKWLENQSKEEAGTKMSSHGSGSTSPKRGDLVTDQMAWIYETKVTPPSKNLNRQQITATIWLPIVWHDLPRPIRNNRKPALVRMQLIKLPEATTSWWLIAWHDLPRPMKSKRRLSRIQPHQFLEATNWWLIA